MTLCSFIHIMCYSWFQTHKQRCV